MPVAVEVLDAERVARGLVGATDATATNVEQMIEGGPRPTPEAKRVHNPNELCGSHVVEHFWPFVVPC